MTRVKITKEQLNLLVSLSANTELCSRNKPAVFCENVAYVVTEEKFFFERYYYMIHDDPE